MSFKKAALEKSEGHSKNACLHYWQAVRGLRAILASLAAFISLSGLLGVAAPTLAQAQTTSTAPYLDSKGWTVFTPTPITSGTCAAGTANGTCIFYVSDSDGNDCNNGLSSVANRTGCGAGPLKTIAAGYQKLYSDKVVSPLGCFSKRATLLPIKVLQMILRAAVSVFTEVG